MKIVPQKRQKSSLHSERGYVLLTLLLAVALLIIAAAAVLPAITFEIRRDKEEELIHRGVQYSRAIRAYYKKFGRYPTRIEELQSTNNMRFLRKRYKDPITGQDFKLLHFGEVKLTFSGGIGGATNLNQPASPNAPSGFGASANGAAGSAFGQPPGGFVAATRPSPPPDQNGASSDQNAPDQNQNQNAGPGVGDAAAAGQGQQPSGANSSSSSSSSDQLSGQTFGGGPIVGVISVSKKESIREFNHKKKYDQWQFVYDPALDRGGLLNTPNQPPIQGFGNQNQAGQSAQPGGPNSFFGPQQGQGNSPGQFNQNPGSPTSPTQPGGSPDQQ